MVNNENYALLPESRRHCNVAVRRFNRMEITKFQTRQNPPTQQKETDLQKFTVFKVFFFFSIEWNRQPTRNCQNWHIHSLFKGFLRCVLCKTLRLANHRIHQSCFILNNYDESDQFSQKKIFRKMSIFNETKSALLVYFLIVIR